MLNLTSGAAKSLRVGVAALSSVTLSLGVPNLKALGPPELAFFAEAPTLSVVDSGVLSFVVAELNGSGVASLFLGRQGCVWAIMRKKKVRSALN